MNDISRFLRICLRVKDIVAPVREKGRIKWQGVQTGDLIREPASSNRGEKRGGQYLPEARSLALVAFWPDGLAKLLSAVWYNPQ